MANFINLSDLEKALRDEDFSSVLDDPRWARAVRFATNPGGCKDCGARTRIAVPINLKKPEGPHQTACCKVKV